MRAQFSLRKGGKNGFNGNIWGQQFASRDENALQHAASRFSNLPERIELEIWSTHLSTLNRDDQHFTKSIGKPGGKSPGIVGGGFTWATPWVTKVAAQRDATKIDQIFHSSELSE